MFTVNIPDDIAIDQILGVHQDTHTKRYYHIINRSSSCFVYVLSGKSVYTMKNGRFAAAADDIFYLAEGECYEIDVDPAEEFSYIYVNFKLNESHRNAFCTGLCMSNSREQLLETFWKLRNIYFTKETLYLLACRITLSGIFMTLIQSERRKYMPSEKARLLQAAVGWMESHYQDSTLTIARIAANAGISEGYFRRLFREFYRVSPSQYLQELRLSGARELLAESEMQISDIAASCGFSSSYYFSAVFRSASGISPTIWRKQHRETSK